jgi:16S rRNA (uracil1498-N3)-methyltransferase
VTREQRGPRIFVSGLDEHLKTTPDAPLILPPESSHHIKDVLRLREGERLEVADPIRGSVYEGAIDSLAEGVHVRILASCASSTAKIPQITLLCALCKGQKNDLICDWATELGVARIVYWQATRSVVRLHDAKDLRSKESRFAKIALAAAQQSRQAKTPTVLVTSSLSDALAVSEETGSDSPSRMSCSLSEDTIPIRSALSTRSDHSPIHIVIGPEGDLTHEEEGILSEKGFVRVSLGDSVLRSELAAVAAILAAKESAS